jgi:mRNA interferase MazF
MIGCGSFPGDLFVVPLTSQLGHVAFELADWREAGLNVPSGIKAQLATVDSSLALKVVGRLSVADTATFKRHLRQWLAL